MKIIIRITLALLVLITVVYAFTENLISPLIFTVSFVLLLALLIALTLLNRALFIKSHSVCPKCGSPLKKKRKTRIADPSQERVRLGGTRILKGRVMYFSWVLHCDNCGHEIKF